LPLGKSHRSKRGREIARYFSARLAGRSNHRLKVRSTFSPRNRGRGLRSDPRSLRRSPRTGPLISVVIWVRNRLPIAFLVFQNAGFVADPFARMSSIVRSGWSPLMAGMRSETACGHSAARRSSDPWIERIQPDSAWPSRVTGSPDRGGWTGRADCSTAHGTSRAVHIGGFQEFARIGKFVCWLARGPCGRPAVLASRQSCRY